MVSPYPKPTIRGGVSILYDTFLVTEIFMFFGIIFIRHLSIHSIYLKIFGIMVIRHFRSRMTRIVSYNYDSENCEINWIDRQMFYRDDSETHENLSLEKCLIKWTLHRPGIPWPSLIKNSDLDIRENDSSFKQYAEKVHSHINQSGAYISQNYQKPPAPGMEDTSL